jgi:crotonobetainyl-CoA:carnitine CoA-transferase CaiB-like acyl-CoA transferase
VNDVQQQQVLQDIRVLELTTTIAGPFCGRLLADFGADVIKIEPARGDDIRLYGKRKDDVSLYASSLLRNKRLISLDPRHPEAQSLIYALVKQVSVFIENFRPGTMEKWNLAYETLRTHNPSLVMVRISGFGQTGPYRHRPGYGIISEAMSGLRHVTGEPDRPPSRLNTSLTDYITGLYAAFATMMALRHRDRTGVGQLIDAALSEAAFSFMEPHVPAYDQLKHNPTRTGSALENAAPNNLYVTQDSQYILIAAPADAGFRRLVAVMGNPGLADDPRFVDMESRWRNVKELDAIISAWTGQHKLAELEALLDEATVPASPVYTMADIFRDPHFAAREMLLEQQHAKLGRITLPGIVPKMSKTPGRVRWPGRDTGQDTRSVLRELLQLSADQLNRLESEGVIYSGKQA